MKIKYNAIAKIELHDPMGIEKFSELLKHPNKKIKIDGKYYYISDLKCDFEFNTITFTEIEAREHEIEIEENSFNDMSGNEECGDAN